MQGFEDNPLEKAGLRHKLTLDERAQIEAWLVAHPEQRFQLEDDISLNELLHRLSDKPVSTNFTTQVMLAIERESNPVSKRFMLFNRWFSFRWMPRIAVVLLALSLGTLGYLRHQNTQRVEFAHNVAKVAHVTQELTVDVLQNFDAIQRLGPTTMKLDEDLFAALR